jgi:hypothetical protein
MVARNISANRAFDILVRHCPETWTKLKTLAALFLDVLQRSGLRPHSVSQVDHVLRIMARRGPAP